MAAPLYLLDTNIVLNWATGSALAEHVRRHYRLDDPVMRPMISTVTIAECYALANYRQWNQERLALLGNVLDQLIPADTNHPEVLSHYVQLYRLARDAGHGAKDEKNQNDLWIGSCSLAYNATLITADRDFRIFSQNDLPHCLINAEEFAERPGADA